MRSFDPDTRDVAHETSPVVISVFPGTIAICDGDDGDGGPRSGTPPLAAAWRALSRLAKAFSQPGNLHLNKYSSG
jgi:hypothetical protein